MTSALHRANPTRPMRFRSAVTLLAAAAFTIALAVLPGSFADSASAAPVVSQCSSVDNTPGLLIECDVDVTNTLDLATGAATSTVVVRECHGDANTANPTCVTTTETSSVLTTSVEQCNYAVNGGGANVICNVSVSNQIVGDGSAVPASVNQCNGSGAEGPEPTLLCDPADASTTGATITQCNGSANGGGAAERVVCSVGVSTETSALRVAVNQCNNSANGGGSTVECAVSIRNIFTAVGVEPTPTEPTPTEPAPTVPGTPAAPGSPETPTSPDVPGAPGAPGTPGSPQTPGTPSSPQGPDAPGTPESPDAPEVLPRTLAETGSDNTIPLAVGFGALLVGATLVLIGIGRRKISTAI